MSLNLAAVMQAVADTAVSAGVVKIAYGYPATNVQPGQLIVDYPKQLDFDATFGRGSDHLTMACLIVCGNNVERATRDLIAKYIDGANGIKDALDGDLGGAVQTCRVTDASIVTWGQVTNSALLAVQFDLDIYT